MDSLIQAQKMVDFKNAIFPIWRGIYQRDQDIDDGGQTVTDLETLHKCDIAIFDSGIKPDRIAPQRDAPKRDWTESQYKQIGRS